MSVICLDTQPVLWGIQSFASEGEGAMINRTRAFLNDLSEKGEQIMIPSPVVLESLLTLSDEEMQKQRAILQSRFFIPSFDLPASVEAASLLNNREVIQKLRNGGARREHLKIDAQIASIAIVNGAKKIISHDKYLKSIAQNKISVEEVPPVSEQLNLLQKENSR